MPGGGLCTPEARAAAERVGPLKITKIEAVRFRPDLRIQGIAPNWTWVRLHTDKGIVGIGESYSGAGHEAAVAVLKAYAGTVLGKDATNIERLWQDLFYRISYAPWGGSETRMLTAINIAQWDILGKASGLPVYKLLGGKVQERLLVYNTMNGWPINGMREHDAPEKITEEPYGIMYLEDVMLPDNLEAYATLARETSIPICISERLATRFRYREMFEQHAVDVVMWDVTWCGGISEAKKISDMADTYKIPTSPHTGGGPVLWFASIHTATALANFYIMESVYHLYNDVYPHFIKDVPVPVNGYVTAPEAPGLGIELRDEVFRNGDAVIETIAEV